MENSYFLIGLQNLDYINKDGRNIKGVKVNLISNIFQNGAGYNQSNFFISDEALCNKLKNLDFTKCIYSVYATFSFYNQKIQLKDLSNFKSIKVLE